MPTCVDLYTFLPLDKHLKAFFEVHLAEQQGRRFADVGNQSTVRANVDGTQ